MTSEERFERIEKTLDRIATMAASESDRTKLTVLESDNRMRRIERAQEYLSESHKQLSESQKQLTESHQKLADDLTTLTSNVNRLEVNLESLLDFMSGSAQRQEEQVSRMSNALQNLMRLFEDHARDGHGGETKK